MVDKYVGLVIRDLEVLKRIDGISKNYSSIKYLVKCIHCGEIKEVTRQTLYRGKIEEGNNCICLCSLSGIKPGDEFGRLTVLHRNLENPIYGRTSWVCQCKCGNKKIATSKYLKNGTTKSCGCLEEENRKNIGERMLPQYEDLTGQKSGRLTVLRLANKEEIIDKIVKNKSKGRYWYCICDCGNSHIVSTSDFKMKKVQSCGCLNSKGEQKICYILEQNQIHFIKQYTFESFNNNGKYYAFDFGVINEKKELSYLIEFDGIQHYDENRQFGSDAKTSFLKIQERDKIKNEFCYKNNIPLIRIPYYHYDDLKIEDLILETSKFIVKE